MVKVYTSARVLAVTAGLAAALAVGVQAPSVAGPASPRPATVRPAATATVPDVVDLLTSTAVSELNAAGFSASVVPFVDHACNFINRVASQNPVGGTVAEVGSVVTIRVGQRPPHPCP
jgi:hypothetical protein